jgi:hypothetical protein
MKPRVMAAFKLRKGWFYQSRVRREWCRNLHQIYILSANAKSGWEKRSNALALLPRPRVVKASPEIENGGGAVPVHANGSSSGKKIERHERLLTPELAERIAQRHGIQPERTKALLAKVREGGYRDQVSAFAKFARTELPESPNGDAEAERLAACRREQIAADTARFLARVSLAESQAVVAVAHAEISAPEAKPYRPDPGKLEATRLELEKQREVLLNGHDLP